MIPNKKKSTYQMDIIFSVILFIVCLFIFKESTLLPKSTYEIIGPAFLPKLLCLLICVCAVMVFIEGLKKRSAQLRIDRETESKKSSSLKPKDDFVKRPKLAFLVVLIMVAYISIMSLQIIRYYILTPLFILILGFLMFRREKKGKWINFLIVLFIDAFALGIGVYYIFTKIFIIDLF
jgi:hypothetical protein